MVRWAAAYGTPPASVLALAIRCSGPVSLHTSVPFVADRARVRGADQRRKKESGIRDGLG